MRPDFKRVLWCTVSDQREVVYLRFIIANIFDAQTKEHLMTGFMNSEAWKKTQETKVVYLWSTSRDELWRKGATSGNEMKVISQRLDCDCDAVDIYVDIQGDGVACHTGQKSCFHNEVSS